MRPQSLRVYVPVWMIVVPSPFAMDNFVVA
jgi:hypothetical protein